MYSGRDRPDLHRRTRQGARRRGRLPHLEILKLADQVGVPRVLEALRHAARYGAFSHTSVARIVHGKKPRQRTSPVAAESPPKNVAEYLKARPVTVSDRSSITSGF